MSSILKALEKVEESQATRRDGGAGGFRKGRERRPVWVMPAAVLGGAAVAALVTFAAMGGFSHLAAPVSELTAVAKPAATVVAPLYPATEPPGARPEQTTEVQPVEIVVVPTPEASPAPVAKLPTGPAVKAAANAARVGAGAVRVVPASTVRPSAVRAAPVKAAPRQTAPAPVQAIPVVEPAAQASTEKPRQEIRVTGIAWQKDSASSVAIINGRSLQQGGMVEGFKVERIFEDKVVLSGGSGKLEVPLGAGE